MRLWKVTARRHNKNYSIKVRAADYFEARTIGLKKLFAEQLVSLVLIEGKGVK